MGMLPEFGERSFWPGIESDALQKSPPLSVALSVKGFARLLPAHSSLCFPLTY